jgi:hypothetical protein
MFLHNLLNVLVQIANKMGLQKKIFFVLGRYVNNSPTDSSNNVLVHVTEMFIVVKHVLICLCSILDMSMFSLISTRDFYV